VLVITLEAATLSREGAWVSEGARAIFHGSMIELGLLGLLVLILVHSIMLLRRNADSGTEIGELVSLGARITWTASRSNVPMREP